MIADRRADNASFKITLFPFFPILPACAGGPPTALRRELRARVYLLAASMRLEMRACTSRRPLGRRSPMLAKFSPLLKGGVG